MRKLGTISMAVLVTALSAASVQAAPSVRPNTAVWGSTSMLASDARVTTPKARKVSQMSDGGKVVAGVAFAAALGGLIYVLVDKHHDHCESPGGSCDN